jgi:uncharacterized membrane protein YfcA
MRTWSLVLFLCLSLVAEILGTIGGFGSSVFFVPIGNYFLDIKSVLGITALFHLCSNVSKIALFRKGFDKKLILQLGIPSVIFVIAGAWLSKYINKSILELSLSIFLVTLSLFFIIARKLVLKPNLGNSIVGGSISGFLAGILGTGGAVRGITMAAYNLEKSIFITTSAIIDLGIDATRTVVYFINGYVHTHDLYLIPFLLGISFLGSWIGKMILKKVPQEKFRLLALILILLVGLATLGKYLNDEFQWISYSSI